MGCCRQCRFVAMQWAVVQQASRNTAHVSVASCLDEEEEETAVGNWRMGTSYSGRMGSCIKQGGGEGGQSSVAFHDSPPHNSP